MPRYAKRANGTAKPWRFAPGRQWTDRELKEMRRLYVDKKVSAAALARLFKTATTQVYRLARIHDWPHRKPGLVANPHAVRNLGWKHAEIYRCLLPTLGHVDALAEAWRGKIAAQARDRAAQREDART